MCETLSLWTPTRQTRIVLRFKLRIVEGEFPKTLLSTWKWTQSVDVDLQVSVRLFVRISGQHVMFMRKRAESKRTQIMQFLYFPHKRGDRFEFHFHSSFSVIVRVQNVWQRSTQFANIAVSFSVALAVDRQKTSLVEFPDTSFMCHRGCNKWLK